jgi:hypothetical protein
MKKNNQLQDSGDFLQVQSNLILDGVLDAYLHTHNFSIFYPVLSQVCGDMAEDATAHAQDIADIFQTLLTSGSEALLHR